MKANLIGQMKRGSRRIRCKNVKVQMRMHAFNFLCFYTFVPDSLCLPGNINRTTPKQENKQDYMQTGLITGKQENG